jgi:hypothetical protein
MRKKVLIAIVAGLALPALALAGPLLVRFDGHTVRVHENVQVAHTSAGPVRVRTWSWHGPNGATIVQVSESRGVSPAMPAWAVAQMRALQAQMRQMQMMQAAFEQPMLMPSFPLQVLFEQPFMAMPQLALPVNLLQSVVPVQIVPLPLRVITIVPAPAARHSAAHASSRRGGLLT